MIRGKHYRDDDRWFKATCGISVAISKVDPCQKRMQNPRHAAPLSIRACNPLLEYTSSSADILRQVCGIVHPSVSSNGCFHSDPCFDTLLFKLLFPPINAATILLNRQDSLLAAHVPVPFKKKMISNSPGAIFQWVKSYIIVKRHVLKEKSIAQGETKHSWIGWVGFTLTLRIYCLTQQQGNQVYY